MDFVRTGRRMHEINMTPLIDIVFHLMVFVMLTTTFVISESMELSLPSTKSKANSPSNLQALRIEMQVDGTLMVNHVAMTPDQLNLVLAEKLGDAPDTKVAIFTTPGVKVQQLVSVMDMVYLTGGRNIQVDKVR